MIRQKVYTFVPDISKDKNKVVQEYSIELLEEYDNVNFYSIRIAGRELTELEAFFEKFPEGCEYDDEIELLFLG